MASRRPLGSRAGVVGGRLASALYDDLKQQLIAGRLAPGQALVVTEICAEHGISKQPVMEALRALAADRLVEIQPQVGVRVREFTPAEIEAFFWLFSRSEGALAHRAALQRTDAEVAQLEVLCTRLEALEAAAPTEQQQGYLAANQDLHALIHQMARSELVEEISQGLWDLSDFLIATHGDGVRGRLPERNHGHRQILDAIRARDGHAAEAAMIAHILATPLAGRGEEPLSTAS
ncbi:GntR family transcriptional regulator [Granulicoccus phenolivorans]|uniref:GntR family transcriptional regulator n=1 Tax=Granulicoccus phenolivorans TaxID=266854 RepID=UPI00040708EB|nr:GntR family transcriptional regulator [Granulicoccus phenolivorans]